MSREIIKYIHECNLVACYLLPLLEISKFNFGEDNFVNAYVSPQGDLIYVEVRDFEETEEPYHCDQYNCTLDLAGRKFIVFTLPEKWKHTFQMFCKGQYSQFTKAAKATIIQYSGLHWKLPITGTNRMLTDARLLALKREQALIRELSDQLEISERLLQGKELIAPPEPSEFLDLELDGPNKNPS
jgi:hypothetical protein